MLHARILIALALLFAMPLLNWRAAKSEDSRSLDVPATADPAPAADAVAGSLSLRWEHKFISNMRVLQLAAEPEATYASCGQGLFKLNADGTLAWQAAGPYIDYPLIDVGDGGLATYTQQSEWRREPAQLVSGRVLWFDRDGRQTGEYETAHAIETLINDRSDPQTAYYSAPNVGLVRINFVARTEEVIYPSSTFNLRSNLLQRKDGRLSFVVEAGLITLDRTGSLEQQKPASLNPSAAVQHMYLDAAHRSSTPDIFSFGTGLEQLYEQSDGTLLVTRMYTGLTKLTRDYEILWADQVRAGSSVPIPNASGWLVFDPKMRIWQVEQDGGAKVVNELELLQTEPLADLQASMYKLRSGRLILCCPGTLRKADGFSAQFKLTSQDTVYWLLDPAGQMLAEGEYPAKIIWPRFQLPNGDLVCQTDSDSLACFAVSGE